MLPVLNTYCVPVCSLCARLRSPRSLCARPRCAHFRLPCAAGDIKLVETEAECDAACADLRRFDQIGFDTESVAYINGSGVNSGRAAIGQACGDGTFCYMFLFYKWQVLLPPLGLWQK